MAEQSFPPYGASKIITEPALALGYIHTRQGTVEEETGEEQGTAEGELHCLQPGETAAAGAEGTTPGAAATASVQANSAGASDSSPVAASFSSASAVAPPAAGPGAAAGSAVGGAALGHNTGAVPANNAACADVVALVALSDAGDGAPQGEGGLAGAAGLGSVAAARTVPPGGALEQDMSGSEGGAAVGAFARGDAAGAVDSHMPAAASSPAVAAAQVTSADRALVSESPAAGAAVHVVNNATPSVTARPATHAPAAAVPADVPAIPLQRLELPTAAPVPAAVPAPVAPRLHAQPRAVGRRLALAEWAAALRQSKLFLPAALVACAAVLALLLWPSVVHIGGSISGLMGAPLCFTLTLSGGPSGRVSASPPHSPRCAASRYEAGAVVELTAFARPGWTFASWRGAAEGRSSTLLLDVPALDATLTATFVTVLGEPTADSSKGSPPPFGLDHPKSVAVSSKGERFVADTEHSRVLVYPRDTTTPSRVIGQSDLRGVKQNRGSVPTASSLSNPAGLALDAEDGLYVCDTGNHRVLYFPPGSVGATRVYGQGGRFDAAVRAFASATSLLQPTGVAVTRDGVWIADLENHRVLFYPGTSTTATRVLGQPSMTDSALGTAADRLHRSHAACPDASGGVYVVDSYNHRVLYFSAGASAATRVYGQPDFTSNKENGPSGIVSATSLFTPTDCVLDAAGGLYVADGGNHRVLYYSPGSTTATRVWGQRGDFSSNEQNKGGVSLDSLYRPFAVTLDRDGRFYVADTGNDRVLGFA